MTETDPKQRRPRRPRKTDAFVDMAYTVKPLEDVAVDLSPGVLKSALNRKLAGEYGKFKSSWKVEGVEEETEAKGTAQERVLAEMTRTLLDKVAEVVATGEPRELLGVTSDFWTGGPAKKRPKPYVVLEDPRVLYGDSSITQLSSMRTYKKLVENLKSELGVDNNTIAVDDRLTQEEENRLLYVTKASDPEFGALMFDNNIAYDDPKLVRVQRFPVLPGYVLQRATSEHQGLAVREVWSFAKARVDTSASWHSA